MKWLIQVGKNLAVNALVKAGFDGELLHATFKQKKEEYDRLITVQGTLERQRLLVKARTAGTRQVVTGGCHLMEYDILIGIEMAS